MQATYTFNSVDGYTLSITGDHVAISKGCNVLSVMRWESWEDIHAYLRMEGKLIAAGQLEEYC